MSRRYRKDLFRLHLGRWGAKHDLRLKEAASLICRDSDPLYNYHRMFDWVEAQEFAQEIFDGV